MVDSFAQDGEGCSKAWVGASESRIGISARHGDGPVFEFVTCYQALRPRADRSGCAGLQGARPRDDDSDRAEQDLEVVPQATILQVEQVV